MKKSFSGMFVAALALMGVLGTSSKANAALLIDFDNIRFDGGTFTSLGGNNFQGTDILFDTILYKDTSTGIIAGAQCGVSTTAAGALESDACRLSFNTLAGTMSMTAPTGLWNIGADFAPYTADRGGFIAGSTGNVLSGAFTNWQDFGGAVFIGTGLDLKDADLLAFFGLPASTTFEFVSTEIHVNATGQVVEADFTNVVTPEPATMMLLGTGLLAAFRARRKTA